jgi:3-deoxy-manno-octulosonate cytidylyltransferase (CMP-KDO synthetase)
MIIGVIPARLESTRFPRKILFPINNRPMLVHVHERAVQSKKLDKVIVAVDSVETTEVLKDHGIDSVMTSHEHQSGTDRIAEVIAGEEADIIVNLQADEPNINSQMIDDLVATFDDDKVKMATLASTAITAEDLVNENTVKVDIDDNSDAIGFYRRIDDCRNEYFRHIGIYGYRRETLDIFTNLPQSENEIYFKLEQLRALDYGIHIKVVLCDYEYHGIDVLEDLKQFD